MNIVKGVADLIRKSSSGQSGDSGSGSHAERSSLPATRIRFSEVGDEAILYTLWERYEKESDTEEKRKLFHVFMKQFLILFKNWEPIDSDALSKDTLLRDQPKEELSYINDTFVGCTSGHPAEVILALTQEIAQLTAFVAEMSGSDTQLTTDLLKPPSFLNISSEGISALDALTIVTRSVHNCRVFGFYGGIQKLTALMKGAVIQLKTISGVLDVGKSSSIISLDKVKLLQKILLSAVSIICNFIDPNSSTRKRMEFSGRVRHTYSCGSSSVFHPSNVEAASSDVTLCWHQKAVVSVMEAGGLNWLVELLRVIRRLSMKEQWTGIYLQSLTLRALQSALCENPRGQSHFKSIGGLEVLLDGLGIPINSTRKIESITTTDENRDGNSLLELFQLHISYFEVLREAVFGNFSNLQFLCENGRVDKFANSFCSLGFIFKDYKQQTNVLTNEVNIQMDFDIQKKGLGNSNATKSSDSLPPKGFYPDTWNNYVKELSEILCSFLIDPQDSTAHNVNMSSPRIAVAISPLYGELSVKWLLRVLATVFPCFKACSDHNELPSHIRVFINTLQHYVLNALRKVFASSSVLLETLRNEGIWDLFFSESFFYFEAASDGESCAYEEIQSSPNGSSNCKKAISMEVLRIEVISFVELAATSDGSAHNLPEISVLLDALEQSACNPELANILAKSLLCILQLSAQKTLASFKTVQAIPRVLKVVCVQAQESKKSAITGLSPGRWETEEPRDHAFEGPSLFDMSMSWHRCMEMAMELFTQFLSAAHDAKDVILSSTACIDSLFELFWEERLRSHVLKHVLDLMKVLPSFVDDQNAKMYLCSKYLETFAHIREREKSFADLCIDLLVGMRDLIQWDPMYFQDLFRDAECFLHVVSLLNGNLEMVNGEELVINVLHTLTCLLGSNDASKDAFRALVGNGYRTLQSLLLDFCQWHPSEGLLNALLDMLVDGKFDVNSNPVIKNGDVIILYLSVLQKSSESVCHNRLNLFQQLLRDSISNRASCVSAGMLSFLLDWFLEEESDNIIMKIAQLIQVIGGHSISGKDIRKIFALLRSEKVGARQQYYSLLLTSVLAMLNEKGPTAFFELSGTDSGIKMKTPLLWPVNKGFSFSCWLRVESFPGGGAMSLFSFLTENGRGCFAMLLQDKLIYESINLKRNSIQLPINLIRKRWHFLCITHSIGRAFSGGSLLKCYLDGNLVSSDRCRYPRVNELLTNCTVGAKISLPMYEVDGPRELKESSPFHGQIGPVYVFNDALSSELVQGIYLLGPSYMYSFLDHEAWALNDSHLTSGVLDAKDGLASKILLGLNAQASDGRKLFNASAVLDHAVDKKLFEATIMVGTQLCSRRLLQQIIYCVGGVSVFFPLIAQSDKYEYAESRQSDQTLLTPITKERVTAEVIELVASVLDENLANQQQMHLLSGFSILGFLLQSVPPDQLNLETLSAFKHLFNVVANCGLAELLVKEAISSIFLNPLIWVYTTYRVQRELYMFLIQQFDNDPRLLTSLCRLPRVIDIIRQFYWDVKSRFSLGGKPLLHPVTKVVIGERPNQEEIHKIRLLLLSLGEMSLRQNIAAADIKALVAFFDTSQDMTCIEDILHMIIRAMSQKPLLASFLDQVNMIGGCHIFVNLLQREFEPVRLLSLQFLGRLLVGLPSEKKGSRFFNLGVGKSRSISEGHRNIGIRMQPIFAAIADRLFKFPQTDNLCATLFDVLLGGASPKQVLQRQHQSEKQRSKGCNSHFFLPQMLILIFRFLSGCKDTLARLKILRDLNDLLDSNPLNIESFMDHGWTSWLMASAKLDVLKNYREDSLQKVNEVTSERSLARNLFCIVLGHHIQLVKGGWQLLEETVNFILMHCEPDGISYQYLLRDIFDDLVQRLVDSSSEENIFISQPCRDNTLFLLRLIDEMLIAELDNKLPFPASSSDFSLVSLDLDSHKEFNNALQEVLLGETNEERLSSRNPADARQLPGNMDILLEDGWWNFYDNLWILISEINGKGPSKTLPRSSLSGGPSLGQRARGLVESLNIPAAEMAAAVVSGGIGTALGGKNSKSVDKAMLLRGERCPRIIFRLVILYLCRSSLERASRCAQQFISLLPSLLVADDEQSRTRLQLFIWALLSVRSRYGMLDDGARFHVISHLIRETVNCGKTMLASSIASRDDSSEFGSNSKESSTIHNLIQKDRVLMAVADEAKYMKSLKSDRDRQLHELTARVDETASAESISSKAFEDEIQNLLSTIIASDDNRKAAFRLSHEEQQQNVTEKWMHLFRSLIDERGPWSANPFPNISVRHWKLDKTEDRWRRRQKLRQNYHFDDRLCYPPSSTTPDETVSLNETKSGFVGQIPEQMKRFLLKGVHKITDEGSTELNEDENESIGQRVSVSEDPLDGQRAQVIKDGSDHNLQERLDSSPETDTNEVLMSAPCVLVTPKRKLAGHLAVMKTALHFFGEFIVEGTGGSSVFKNFEVSSVPDSSRPDEKQKLTKWPVHSDQESDKNISVDSLEVLIENLHQNQFKNLKRHRRWNIGKVKVVHWTRYLLRYTATEIFFSDSTSPVFLNFSSQKEAKAIGTLIVSTRNEFLFPKGSKDKNGIISFVDRRVALEMAETARERWRRREITNFEYLMILNTLAGRSYNDLTQYPVFPWVLSDYSSEILDFNKSSTFRDLTKPVGALDPKRFEVFEDRYRNFCDPDIPSFYYGSHYSSMGIVLYYLPRLEPFTALHRNLQGGKFDHADRLFQSVEGTYRNCLSNTSDVKELIPEFFYMPEFLINANSYHMGVRQDGEPIGDVCLPPWAKGSPEEFVHKNREALESEYVSSNLHHWIDLVFGYKQRGKPAVEAANVFYYLTYEGAVDLDAMEDDLQRSAIEDQIANFGQTPIQIFRKKHPRRGPPIPIAHPLYFAPSSINLTSIVSISSHSPSAILYVGLLDSSIVLVNQGLTLSVKMWLTTQLQSGGNFTFSGSQEPFFGIGSDILSPRNIGSPLAEDFGGQHFATLQTPNESFLISCGNWENSFKLISLNDGRMVQSVRQHKDVVNCVAVTSDGSILATGSYDTTVMVWEVYRARGPEKRMRSSQEISRKDYIVEETPFHILCGHDDIITCLYVSVELDIVISGSKDGTCIFHTLREGRYVRSIRHPSGSPLSKLAASRHGRIVLYADNDLSLHLYSINGKHLASCESNGRLNCTVLSNCEEFLVCGGDQGQIVVRSMKSLEIVQRYSGVGKIITSLMVTPEECFLAGTRDGSLLVYSIENPQLRKATLPHNVKFKSSSTGHDRS